MTNSTYKRNVLLATPLSLATILLVVAVAHSFNTPLDFKIILLGALGWWLALLLRLPVVLLLKLFKVKEPQKIIIWASGPAEELVRLAFLVVLGLTVSNAFSLAVGWAFIEILYGIIQAYAMASLSERTDEKAEEAKEFLRAQGMDKSLELSAPFWGIIERVSANFLHLCFSLLLLVSPLMVLITAPLHSFMNYLITRMIKRSLMFAEIVLLVVSLMITTLSLYVTFD